MKPGYFTIVKLSPNTNAGDSISIGLIVESGDVRFAKFSRSKIDLALRLRGEGSSLISNMVQQMEQYYTGNVGLTSEKMTNEGKIDIRYFQNLHASSINFVQFSDPELVEVSSHDDCMKLFRLFIEDSKNSLNKITRHKSSVAHRLKSELFPRIRNNVLVNQKVTPAQLPKLERPFKFDGLGKNGNLITINGLDIDAKPDTLYSHYQRYEIVRHYLLEATGMIGKEFLVIEEPRGNSKENFLFYDRILKEKEKVIVNPDDFIEIVNFIQTNNVKKFNLDELLKI